MTEVRARQFYDAPNVTAIEAQLSNTTEWRILVYKVRSMHQVKYVGSGDAMRTVCDCKGYMHCGLCAYSLHTLHLAGKID
jgi:hypothetical protein